MKDFRKTLNKFFILAMAILFVAVSIMSIHFSYCNIKHDCCGENCEICQIINEINQLENGKNNVSNILGAFLFVAILFVVCSLSYFIFIRNNPIKLFDKQLD